MTLSESQMHATSGLLAAIVDSSDDAIISKTLEGIVTSWNRAAEKMFGYSATDAIGQDIRLIIPPERRAEEVTILGCLRRGEKVDHFDTIRQTKDGRQLHISLTVSPVKDAHGRIVGASKVARDITERKRAEQQIELLLARERDARTMAEEATRLKDNLLATISHELRNPLNAIVGWASLLHTGKLDADKIARATEAILRSARAQDQLISDLLDTSRIITGRLRLDVRPLQLIQVLDAAVETTRAAAEAKGVHLEVRLDRSASSIVGDAGRLQQVVWHLLSNAVKFTPMDGRVQIILERRNSYIEFSVRDTGIGIEPELLPYVFDHFRQGDSGASRKSRGLGLGLAIVRHLVELHGGTVRAESNGVGQGATFTVSLPIRPAPRAGGTQPVGLAVRTDSTPTLEGLRVLVVDDDAEAREVVSTILSQAQADTRTAESAAKALNILDEWRADVLVSDIAMPETDGYELIRKVRVLPAEKGGRIPAAALTAYSRTEDRLRALSAGYQMHIAKPIEPAELLTVVANMAGRISAI